MRGTNFVLVHGGYPFVKEAEFLLEKPNVYADFSAQHATPEVSWEESAWMTNRTAREALAVALTGMVRDGDITRGRASELARMVLRENAVRLYGLPR